MVGTTNLNEGGKQYDAEKILIYSDYNFNLKLHDIAIVKSTDIFDKNYIQILNLYHEKLREGDPLILTGFGALEVII